MLSQDAIHEVALILQVQTSLLSQLGAKVNKMSSVLNTNQVESDRADIIRLQKELAELENMVEQLELEDFEGFDQQQILELYSSRRQAVLQIPVISSTDWPHLVALSQARLALDGELQEPYQWLLGTEEAARLRVPGWDRWDVLTVGISGALATLADFMLIRIPTNTAKGRFAGEKASPITAWLKQKPPEWFSNWTKELEKLCKTPYDHQPSGMAPKTHRLQSLGHDPVLGFLFGVLDILRGTVSGFSFDRLTGNHKFFISKVTEKPVTLIEAFLTHIGHLISDVSTPMGLPAPFLSLAQGINLKIPLGPECRTVGELARRMYLNGYDLRHFITAGIGPGLVEALVRALTMLRLILGGNETPPAKLRSMLLAAHAVAAMGNAGKIALHAGNPLCVNLPQWYTLLRYAVPAFTSAVGSKFRCDQLETESDREWVNLSAATAQLFEKLAKEGPIIDLR